MIIYANGPYAELAAKLDGTNEELEQITTRHVGFRLEENVFYHVKALAEVTNTTGSEIMRDLVEIGMNQLWEHLDPELQKSVKNRIPEIARKESK